MNQAVDRTMVLPQLQQLFPVPHARSFVTVVISTLALILACLLFAPSSVTWGALSGSLPFAAIIAIVGLGQSLVVQQGGFDLSLAGGVSLAVVIATHYPQGDNALLLPAILIAIACAILAGLINGILVSFFRLNAIVATIVTVFPSPADVGADASVYAMPTTFGTVVGVCVAPGSGFAASCERSLATLHVSSGSRLSPGPSQVYASGLDSAIKTLDTAQAHQGVAGDAAGHHSPEPTGVYRRAGRRAAENGLPAAAVHDGPKGGRGGEHTLFEASAVHHGAKGGAGYNQ